MIKRWFGRRPGSPARTASARGSAGGRPRPGELDLVLARTVARHFPSAEVEGTTVRLGFGNLEISCRADEPHHDPDRWSAPLYLHLSGGRLGARPVFASISGYHLDSAEQAVAEGACLWSCSFGPVLVSALTGVPDPQVRRDEVTVRGRRGQLLHAHLDRAFTDRSTDGQQLAEGVRAALGGKAGLAPAVLAALPPDRVAGREVALLSVFVMEGYGRRTVEVKVNGVDVAVDWPGADVPCSDAGGLALLRELAVLVLEDEPVDGLPLPQTWDRPGVEAVLSRLAGSDAPGQVAGWRGWRTHGGRLGAVIPAATLRQFEAVTGTLPEDYRTFLTEIAGSGAGPGYGLLPPRRIGDVVPLAQAGCNAVWVLRVGEHDHGSVWVDSRPLDGGLHRVADSFTDWYRDWLENGLRGRGAWTHWSPVGCPTSGLQEYADREGAAGKRTAAGAADLSGFVTRMSINGWNDYLPPPRGPMRVDLCQGCAENLARHNVPEDVVERGALSGGGPR